MNAKLQFLREKYGVAANGVIAGNTLSLNGKTVRLLPWRVERRFVELQKIVDGKTLDGISTLRFANFRYGGDLKSILTREFGLAAWLGKSPVKQLFATGAEGIAYNVVAKLQNGIGVAVECGTKLPEGPSPIDRHEIIARRGVASDRVVDTQVPQASIYTFTEQGNETFTDVDTELFGLSEDEIWIVRAAFAVLSNPELADQWNRAFADAEKTACAVLESNQTRQPVQF